MRNSVLLISSAPCWSPLVSSASLPSSTFSNDTFKGIVLGVSSGLTIPFVILGRKKYLIGRYNSWDITAYEISLASLILVPFMLFGGGFEDIPDGRNIVNLLLLGFVSTGVARMLYVSSQKNLSGKTVGLTIVLEVVYGVIFAMVFLSEAPTLGEVAGGTLVLSVVIFETLRVHRSRGVAVQTYS